ncbi:MAG: sigma-70 family RNA polymerase sigma factor [Planctomycetota bacterium]
MQTCVATFGDLVWTIARRGVGPDAAADVVQEAFLSIWKDAARFDPARGSAKTFVAVLTRRRMIDYQRRQPGGTRVSGEDQNVCESVASGDAGPDQQAQSRDAAGQVGDAIARLDPPKPELLRMAYYQGLSHSKIAEATGMPLGTIKTHLRRAMESLRVSLQPLEETS